MTNLFMFTSDVQIHNTLLISKRIQNLYCCSEVTISLAVVHFCSFCPCTSLFLTLETAFWQNDLPSRSTHARALKIGLRQQMSLDFFITTDLCRISVLNICMSQNTNLFKSFWSFVFACRLTAGKDISPKSYYTGTVVEMRSSWRSFQDIVVWKIL